MEKIDHRDNKARKVEERTFYDAHMHAYNLSHPSIGAILYRIMGSLGIDNRPGKSRPLREKLLRIICDKRMISLSIMIAIVLSVVVGSGYGIVVGIQALVGLSKWFLVLIILSIASGCAFLSRKGRVIVSKLSNVMNLLLIMDYGTGEFLLQLESELVEEFYENAGHCKNSESYKNAESYKGSSLNLLNQSYTRYALSPLMMDFSGERNYLGELFGIYDQEELEGQLFFDLPSYRPKNKPIMEQEFDLFKGIKHYYDHSNYQLLEFYPFRGIEFNEYVDEDELRHIVNRHFKGLPEDGHLRKKVINENVRIFPQKTTYHKKAIMKEEAWEDAHIYAGFKVYPPLGFDPWPLLEEAVDEKDRLRIEAQQSILSLFYRECVAYNIPIITHCGSNQAGTEPDERFEILTSPKRWQPIFEAFEGIKVCFGHFGIVGKGMGRAHLEKGSENGEWFKLIQTYMKAYGQSDIYADISCLCFKASDYDQFIDLMEDPLLARRIIFGSDYPMTSFNAKDYKSYIRVLNEVDNKKKSQEALHLMCEVNPQQFLFG